MRWEPRAGIEEGARHANDDVAQALAAGCITATHEHEMQTGENDGRS
ncbi:hypothetical protein RSSM_00741 [Rhodopirellula sallentina SM41]|uniref:Uncharacterized protein n=1 Tax=Rhodopirellula sallentina SM41 TaxID=1263870 RepID=M5U8I7_9BACT|nr:hypothetical protein RSSM_00741 [Rhodopirellula sallentina SM41]